MLATNAVRSRAGISSDARMDQVTVLTRREHGTPPSLTSGADAHDSLRKVLGYVHAHGVRRPVPISYWSTNKYGASR